MAGPERVRIAWFFAAFLVAVLTSVLPVPPVVQLAGVASVPIALGVAMYQGGLYSADRALSRTLVHVVLTVVLTALIGAIVGLAAYGMGGTGIAAARRRRRTGCRTAAGSHHRAAGRRPVPLRSTAQPLRHVDPAREPPGRCR